jgi:hypothetical protein
MTTAAASDFPLLPTSSREGRRHAITTLLLALLGGTVTQALFWKTGIGLNFFLWDLAIVGALFAVFPRRGTSVVAWGAASASVLLGFSVVRFASPWTLTIALPVDFALLAALPLVLSESVTLRDIGSVPLRLLLLLPERARRATATLAAMPRAAAGEHGPTAGRHFVRGLFIGLPTAGLFAALLASDVSFRSAVGRIIGEAGDAAIFAALSALSSAAYLIVHALHAASVDPPPPDEKDSVPGRAPYRRSGDAVAPSLSPAGPRVAASTWAVVVGQVCMVFAVFVAANARHLFGGAALVRSPAGSTYAAYLHSGFALLLCATMLSVGLVVLGHALLVPRDALPGERIPGGGALASMETALLVLTGVTLASCWQRLCVYEDAYGASRLRLGVFVIELAVFGLLALTLAKVLFRRWRGYGGATLLLGVGAAVLATSFNGDAYIARRNLDRAASGKGLDEAYLASLGVDARSAIAHPFVTHDPALSARLRARFCASSRPDWRSFRGIGTCQP